MRTPQEPPIATVDLPEVGGELGSEPEDFVVEELPLHPPSGTGDHLMVRVRKKGMTTPDMVAELAQASGVAERDIGYAGMKDKHAVTTQWVSLPERTTPADSWTLPPSIEVVEISRSPKKLRTGQLAANRFRLRLVRVPAGGLERAQKICEQLLALGLPNYFGAQRFGRGSENLARGVEWLEAGAPARGRRTRFFRKLYPSVVQAEIFNRYVALRVDAGLHRLLDGEVVRLEGSASVFVVDDPERELPRLAARDIHQTGPMIGKKMRAPARDALALERAAINSLELSDTALDTLMDEVDGTRRDIVVRPSELTLTAEGDDCVIVQFVLPAGSYATQLVRELVRSPWSAPSRLGSG